MIVLLNRSEAGSSSRCRRDSGWHRIWGVFGAVVLGLQPANAIFWMMGKGGN